MQLPFFANDEVMIDAKSQDYIQLYNFCTSTNTPVTTSALDTPADIFDAFQTIAGEINVIKEFEESKKAKGRN
mgnify:CR=1 FL=1|tara:strand:+ start:4169 stop:4387 length:219 start_codon:yes stop_codon:yes gene_type:complete